MDVKGISNDLQAGLEKGRPISEHILMVQTLLQTARRQKWGS